MKAVWISRYGGTEVLEFGERPRPVPRRRQVLVRVHAAAVNPRDWLLREGRYVFRFLTRMPVVLGSDFSGVVVRQGPRAATFEEGAEVFGMQTVFGNMGAYAEYIAVDERALARKPAEISHQQAAALPCAGLTAYQALTRIGRVGAGTRVTVIGASGGVGSYAVQIARVLGAEVAAVSSERNRELVARLGATHTVDYRSRHFADVLSDQDLVFDTIGRESLASSAPALKRGGVYVTTIPSAATAAQSLGAAIRRIAPFGSGHRARIVLCRADGRDLAALAELMRAGRIESLIDSVYPLAEVTRAHEKSRSWRTRGKLVLQVSCP